MSEAKDQSKTESVVAVGSKELLGQYRGQCEITPTPFQIDNPSSLARDVDEVCKRSVGVTNLCGEIIATLVVNRERGTVTSADDKYFDRLIKSWSRQLNDLSPTVPNLWPDVDNPSGGPNKKVSHER